MACFRGSLRMQIVSLWSLSVLIRVQLAMSSQSRPETAAVPVFRGGLYERWRRYTR